MNISNYYWYFTSAIPPRICDDIIKYGLSQAETMARTGGYGDRELSKQEIKDIKRKRNSDLVWLNDAWIYKEIQPYVNQANRNAGWNFEWDRSESCQFTKYKLNQYYDWHL
jgi:PKHD-type hydroxylase